MQSNIYYIFARYISLIIIGLFGMSLIYFIFTPLTLFPSFIIIKILYSDAYLNGMNEIIASGERIVLIEACIAGAAYYLLLVLCITTPMKIKKRVQNLFFIITSFLVLNIIRIILFSCLYIEEFRLFDIAHMAVWYVGSTVMLVLIWFFGVYLFKIKEIPVYSDFNYFIKEIRK